MTTTDDDGVPHVYVQVPAAGASAAAPLGAAPEDPAVPEAAELAAPEAEQDPAQDPPGPAGDEGQEVQE